MQLNEIMRKNMVQPDRTQVTIWHVRFARWVIKAADTHLEYVLFIAFPRQVWFRERLSMLCLYVPCLVIINLGLWMCIYLLNKIILIYINRIQVPVDE
jgi:hypothetical protein